MTGTPPVPVAVVEDHPLYLAAVAKALDCVDEVSVVLQCRSVEELLDALDARPREIRVVLLDLALPGRSGADAVRALVGRGLTVLVLSGEAARTHLADVFAAGAAGYLTKAARPEEVAHATRVVAAGRRYVAPDVARLRARAERDGVGTERITAREREVLALLAAGHTDRMIAAELSVSLTTVRSYLERIRVKANMRRRADLTRFAVRIGAADPHDDR